MELQKKKINQIFKKSSKIYTKSPDSYIASSKINHYDAYSPKYTTKKIPLKSSSKGNTGSQKNSEGKKYTFNKTSYGTPFDKSTFLSYLSTPNEKSFNASQKLKKNHYTKRLTSKTKEIFQSTEDQNISEQTLLVHLLIGNKEICSKTYATFSSLSTLKEEFFKELSKNSNIRKNFYGIIGFETIPFNNGVTNIINSDETMVKQLLDAEVNEINIQPQMVKVKPNYQQLNLDNFEIVQHLGCGGFSTVYLAKCLIDGNMCALKFIRKDSITTSKKVRMLENQKNILFSIDHEKLVDLYYTFETKNYIVFGLEYCPNGNLYNFLQKARTVSEEDAKFIIHEILQGLKYLHDNGILFRDIKLENILFNQDGNIKITDFGLSKPELSEEQITYSYCGSPEYMAPEMLAKQVFHNERCGHSFQVDFYALGILLYQLLYGRSPFYAPKKQDIFTAIMNSQPKFPKVPMISKQAKSLIKGLLIKNPMHRIGSLKGVKEILGHPWLRNKRPPKTKIFTFDFQPLQVSSEDEKKIECDLGMDMCCQQFDKFFFPKSFVNKSLMKRLEKKILPFQKKKEKMLKITQKEKK